LGFANGNKRVSRVAANLPLLAAGHIPASFADVSKLDYIRGMAAFYELGSIHVIEQTFLVGYARSVVRSSRLSDSLRVASYDPDVLVASLAEYLNTGRRPTDVRALSFLGRRGGPDRTGTSRHKGRPSGQSPKSDP
jgi:hypothetical protein